eukprot:1689778-Amphidinium_carterae.1
MSARGLQECPAAVPPQTKRIACNHLQHSGATLFGLLPSRVQRRTHGLDILVPTQRTSCEFASCGSQ